MNKDEYDRTYNSIINHYNNLGINGEEKLINRFLFLFDFINEWIKCKHLIEYIGFSEKIVQSIVVDYFTDIIRLKDFHNIKYTNDIKIAAYTVFWINQRKPLFYKKEPTPEEIKGNYFLNDINEWLCLELILSMLYDNKTIIAHGTNELKKYKEFIKALHYDLAYRTITPHFIELALLGLDSIIIHPRLNDGGTGD